MALGEVDYGLMGVVGGLTAFISFLNGIMASGVGRFYALSVGVNDLVWKISTVRNVCIGAAV